MKLVAVISFLFLLSGLSSCVSQQDTYDHSWLVLTWLPSFCLLNAGKPNACNATATEIFTIHGLWPVNKTGYTIHVTLQNGADLSWFNNTRLPVVQDLNIYWRSYGKKYTNEEFWKHEWDDHGSKQNDFRPQVYFQRALSLRSMTGDIVTALANEGVTPDNRKLYSTTKFYNALQTVTGKTRVMLNCKGDRLYEVRICVNRNATAFIECNEDEMNQACWEEQLRFPAPASAYAREGYGGVITKALNKTSDVTMYAGI